MKFIVLAGGFATRLWPITEHRAKSLLLVDGKTVLAHILDRIPEGSEVYLSTNTIFRKSFEQEVKRYDRELSIKIFCEESFSDTGKIGALKAVSLVVSHYKITDNIFFMTGDNILPSLDLAVFANGTSDEACITVGKVSTLYEAKKFGVATFSQTLNVSIPTPITSFEEKPENPQSQFIATGFFFLGSDLFPLLHETAVHSPDALGGIFPVLLAHNKSLKGVLVEGDWFDIGSFETYIETHQKLQNPPKKINSHAKVIHSSLGGKVFIGAHSRIKNCTITDSIVYPGCVLENCHISRSVLDKNVRLKNVDVCQKLVREKTCIEG